MLVVHHLQRSQSERIVWLCEELELPYELRTYKRDPTTFMSPPELQALHPTKAAPVIQDGDITLAESGAIVEYILTKYGQGKLSVNPTSPHYADYLYFLHFGNGYLQPSLRLYSQVSRYNPGPNDIGAKFAKRSFDLSLQVLDERLRENDWLAGEKFTAADIMNVCPLTTMRLFTPFSLEGYDGILAYLRRVGDRSGYQCAVEKGDPGFQPPMGAEKPQR